MIQATKETNVAVVEGKDKKQNKRAIHVVGWVRNIEEQTERRKNLEKNPKAKRQERTELEAHSDKAQH